MKSKGKFAAFIGSIGKGWLITVLVIVLLIIAIRIALSPVATKYANDYLGSELPGYTGHVDCIHFALIRGAYQVEGFYLDKLDSNLKRYTPFASVELIDLSLEWAALFHGKLVGKLFFESPVINFVKDKVEPKQVVEDSGTFQQLLDVSMPLDVNRVEIQNGSVHYKDLNSDPLVDISMNNIFALAENLQNTVDPLQLLPSSIVADADVYGGKVHLDCKLDLLNRYPTFDLQAECKHLNLPGLNPFFKAYGKFTVERGDFSVYSEVASKDGGFKGYVKPLIKDLKILGPDDKDENILIRLWEGILEAVAWVFKNHPQDQLATKIPLEGKYDNPKPDIIYTIFQVLRNAFIEALNPSLDYEINIHNVGAEDARTSRQKFRDTVNGRKKNKELVKDEKSAKDVDQNLTRRERRAKAREKKSAK
ncbi:MAG: DUF748 domain-containing protein [Bacteroidota bacterium]